MIKLYLTALVIFFGLDMVWLGFIAKNFYAKHLAYLMTPNVNWLAAIIFYLIFILGLVVLVIEPNLKQSLINILLKAALFGLVTYATYDLTNLATIKNWPIIMTVVDLIWGMVLAVLVSGSVWMIFRK